MRFSQIDYITDFQAGDSITAVKKLTGEEDYLRDHFPKLPIMPGVLMLEAMFQASAWLVRKTDDFANTLTTLKEANNIKYAGFVEPGQILTITATIAKRLDNNEVKIKAQGMVEGRVHVSGRLTLHSSTIGEQCQRRAPLDLFARRRLREDFHALCRLGESA